LSEIKPGSFGLAIISGKLGWWVDKGQAIVEQQDYTYTHAFLVLDNNEVIEGEPGGAKITPLSEYTRRPAGTVLFSDEPVLLTVDALGVDEDRLREKIVDFGRSLEGTPYSYLDYLSIALDRFGIRPKFIRRRVARHDRLICSELVDYVYPPCSGTRLIRPETIWSRSCSRGVI
jgi:hypothetical protein